MRIGSILILGLLSLIANAQSMQNKGELQPYKQWYFTDWKSDISDQSNLNWLKNTLQLAEYEGLKLKKKTTTKAGIHFQYVHTIQNSEVVSSGVNLHLYTNGNALIQQYLISTKSVAVEANPKALPYLILSGTRLLPCERRLNDAKRQQWEYITEFNEVVLKEDRYQYYRDTTVRARVFMVNPVNSAKTSYGGMYVDNGDQTNDSLDGQLQEVEMYAQYRNDSFFLQHPKFKFREVSGPFLFDKYIQTTDSFFYTRNQKRFEAVNVFYHLTNYYNYLKQLGYDSYAEAVDIDVHGIGGDDNSRFDPSSYTLEFGDGNVDDAEDIEVVLHEYTHALSTTANYTTGNSKQRDAMEEGNCDYICKSYSRSVNDHNSYKVFSWDGHNEFWNGFVINSTKRYPDDLKNQINADRDIWSSALMCMHDFIGRETTDELVLEHLAYQFSNSTMSDMAAILLHVDTILNGGSNYSAIKECLVQKGFMQYSASVDKLEALPSHYVKNSLAFALGEGNLLVSDKEPFNLEFYNLQGKLMLQFSGASSYTIEPHQLAKGMYFVKLIQGNQSYSLKLVR